jgi:hypothetical protein
LNGRLWSKRIAPGQARKLTQPQPIGVRDPRRTLLLRQQPCLDKRSQYSGSSVLGEAFCYERLKALTADIVAGEHDREQSGRWARQRGLWMGAVIDPDGGDDRLSTAGNERHGMVSSAVPKTASARRGHKRPRGKK